MDGNRVISLEGGEIYITVNAGTTVRVCDGSALIYILPMQEGRPGRRIFIYEAAPGTVIPALDYKDYEDNHWNFGISALEKTVLEISETASVEEEKRRFFELINLKNFDEEGFEEGIVEWYRLNIVKEEAFIHKTAQEQKKVYESGLNLIYNMFNAVRKKVDDSSKDALYEAVQYLCGKCKIPVADYERIKINCENDITVENIARISHFTCRKIILEENWYKNDLGGVLAFSTDSNKPYACIPNKNGGYTAYDGETGERFTVTKKFAEGLGISGYMCYRPFENKTMNIGRLILFGLRSIRLSDIVNLLLMTLIGSAIGLFIPMLNQQLYDTYIPAGASSAFIQICCVILAFMIGNVAFSVVKNLAGFRITSRITYDVQSAAYDRLFNLPESFFRQYDSGDLAQRVMGIGGFADSLINMLLSSVLTLIFCIVYLIRMFGYSGILTSVSIAMVVVYAAVMVTLSLKTIKYEKEAMTLGGKVNAVMYQLLSGIAKIRIAGVEDRALFEYLKPYIKLRENNIKSKKIELGLSTFSIIANSLFSIVLYILMIKTNNNMSVGIFIAFTSAFGSFASSVMGLAQTAVSANYIKPSYERIKPILETAPEYDDADEMPGDISGDIELSNVSFAYDENSSTVLNNINLHISPGEYIGIVGPSGCGKSTLLKLLLGFEKPTSGKIYYDGRDIEKVDKRELRKKLGVVLQDGKLISGSIYENITITAPKATYADVNAVVRAVGLEKDIEQMPMGLHTVLSEDCGTISGGQQQRILIARAIVGKPKILYFDEATSALDNLTQAMVCESLDKLNATRLVIAHRLSTIIGCDRIIVIDNGSIAEQGSYQELMEKRGLFYELASRQMA
ncbi:MAG: NHLP bacteriocin export ABC transporter permease/ATPase subunit [Oscillospiraceae bacterium]|nr:NHLP bacteriocin export ABC transporter permease/ATPase subunit [Oscillospiraceae bacterium]